MLRRNGIDARRVPHDRQLGALGRAAGARDRRPGRARAVPPHVGARARPNRRRATTGTGSSTTSARSRRSSPTSTRHAGNGRTAMNPYEEAEVAAAAIVANAPVSARHDVAVVLGSGWGEAAAELGDVVWEGPLTEVPGVPRPTVGGHKGRLVSVDADGRAVLVFAGRSHLYEGHGVPTVVHAVRAAVLGGCSVVVLTNAAGGLDPDVPVGTPVLLRDHLNLTGASPMAGDDPPERLRRALLRPHLRVRPRAARARARDRSRVARRRLRGPARRRVRDARRDHDAAHPRRRPGRHVDGAGDDRRPASRCARPRGEPRHELGGGHLTRTARPSRRARGRTRRRARG